MWLNAGMLVACITFIGCATAEPTTAYSSTFASTRNYNVVPKRDGSDVELFTSGRPSRRYTEVGIITVRDWNYPRVVYFARERASKAGCDALIQTESGQVLHTVQPSLGSPTPEYHTIARFACIVWASAAQQ